MMTKVSFMMQENVRKHYSLITDIFTPNTFFVRGRLAFPQGLSAISILFHNKKPADVYAHKYFIEKQSNPDQPSPQMHITEENQGIMKVIGGHLYMKDDNAKLDNCMAVVTDYTVPVKGRMLSLSAAATSGGSAAGFADHIDGNEHPIAKKLAGIEQLPLAERAHARGHHVPFSPTLKIQSNPLMPGDPKGGGAGQIASRSAFPSPEESSHSPEVNLRYFQSLKDPHSSSSVTVISSAADPCAASLFRECQGGYTVLYNPIEVNDRTFTDMIDKLHAEERVVSAIVVPTRQSWRYLQIWADAFPDAVIISSGPVPLSEDASRSQRDAARSTGGWGGCQDMGNGVTGLSFPEVDLEELEAAGMIAPLSPVPSQQNRKQQQEQQQTRQKQSLHSQEDYEDPVDILWGNTGAMVSPASGFVGLRQEDSPRVRILTEERDGQSGGGSSGGGDKGKPPSLVKLTPMIELHHIEGDAVADEYVMYDCFSRCLFCTDVFHGEYSDMDPVNSWMCRVWFKFMKKGDHKRTDLVPRYKWLQVRRQGTLHTLRGSIDKITTTRNIGCLVYAHGTSPLVQNAANALRRQWGMPLLQNKSQTDREYPVRDLQQGNYIKD